MRKKKRMISRSWRLTASSNGGGNASLATGSIAKVITPPRARRESAGARGAPGNFGGAVGIGRYPPRGPPTLPGVVRLELTPVSVDSRRRLCAGEAMGPVGLIVLWAALFLAGHFVLSA